MLLPVFWLSCLAFVAADDVLAPPGCSLDTTTGYRYAQFHHGTIFSSILILKFRVKARSDAHILLSTSPLALNPVYEIVLGASANSYIDVRKAMTGKSVSAVKTPDVLSDKEFRSFWITYKLASGDLEIGREGESLPILHWKDPDPLSVHYFAFSAWTGIVAKWIHSCQTTATKTSSGRSEGQEAASEELPYDYNVIEKLTGRLFSTYSKGIRPVSNHTDSVALRVGLSVLYFDLDEHSSEFLVNVDLKMNWRDERLTWNATEYDELSVMHVPSDAVWKPDLVLLNSADGSDLQHYPETLAVFYSDGNVIFTSSCKISALCSMDLTNWPYDVHTCDLLFGSNTHDNKQIALALMEEPAIEMNSRFYGNRKWHVFAQSAELISQTEPFPSSRVRFSLSLQRSSPLFNATIITPALGFIVVTLAMFVIPPNSGKKLIVGLTLVFILALYLLFFLMILPPMGDHSPIIVAFFAHTFVLVCFSVVLSALYLHWTRLPTTSSPPAFLITLFSSRLGWVLCLSSLIRFVTPNWSLASKKDGQPINLTEEMDAEIAPSIMFEGVLGLKRHVQMEWLLLACAVDRICGILYMLLLVIYAASYLVA